MKKADEDREVILFMASELAQLRDHEMAELGEGRDCWYWDYPGLCQHKTLARAVKCTIRNIRRILRERKAR
jgi:hypothetical protein